DAELVRAQNPGHAARGLVGTAGAEYQGFPHPVHADLDALRFDGKEIRMEPGRDSPAGSAQLIRIVAGAEQSRREPPRLALQRLLGRPAKEKRSGEAVGLRRELLQDGFDRAGHSSRNLFATASHVRRKTSSALPSAGITVTRAGSRRVIARNAARTR